MIVKAKKISPTAIIPKKGTPFAAGWDLFIDPGLNLLVFGKPVNGEYKLQPGEYIKVSTGIALEIPEGYFGLVKPRSSCFKQGIDISGVVDSDYRGDIFICMQNNSPKEVLIEFGKSYAQLIIINHNQSMLIEEAKDLTTTVRNTNGFGSTGNV